MSRSINKGIRIKAAFAIATVSLIYASVGIPVRILSQYFTLLQQLYLWLFASTLFSFFVFRKHIRLNIFRRLSTRDSLLIIFRALAFYTIGYYLYSFGINETKYGNVAIIYAFPMVALLGVAFLGEKFTVPKFIAIAGAVTGALLIGLKNVIGPLSFGLGELATIASIFFFATSVIARKWLSEKLNNHEITVLMFIIASIATVLASLSIGEGFPQVSWSPIVISAILVTGAMNTAALFFTNYGYQYLDAITADAVSYLDTVFGVLISVLLYQEFLNTIEILGGVLIVASALYITYAKKKHSFT